MKKEFDELLTVRYPEIFVDRHSTVDKSPMAWGFSCGDGWFTILDNLCSIIKFHLEQYPDVPKVRAAQVKEKFGNLRFYYDGGDEFIRGLVQMAEAMSATTCDRCGSVGTTGGKGWILTRCGNCQEKPEGEE